MRVHGLIAFAALASALLLAQTAKANITYDLSADSEAGSVSLEASLTELSFQSIADLAFATEPLSCSIDSTSEEGPAFSSCFAEPSDPFFAKAFSFGAASSIDAACSNSTQLPGILTIPPAVLPEPSFTLLMGLCW